jgi:hypothetical protein
MIEGQQEMFTEETETTTSSFTEADLSSLDHVKEAQTKAASDPVKPENNGTPKQENEEDEDILDILQPKAEPKTWVIGKDDYAREYVQKPLSFIAKMQWFSLVGDVLDQALSGPDGMHLGNLFAAPGGGSFAPQDFREADTFVQAVGKLLAVAPDFLVNSYCIWLNVPDYERPAVAEIMKLPPDEGGLTDEQGMEIIEVFIDQNYEALDSFFRDSLGRLQKRVQTRAQEASKKRK